ncbi:LCP family glycopolymer transferase [Alteribacillus iranensis]|nr:LCP family protein [Alteribacillus iranensis]
MGVLVIGAGGYIWQLATSTIANIQENIDRKNSEMRLETISFEEKDPISVLLMGVDDPISRQDFGRSDTLLLLTINPHDESVNMVSIPRDTHTSLRGERTKGKISHAHALGGSQTAIRTVEHFLDVPVDYYVKANMDSFVDMVDVLGGIEVENEFEFTFHGMNYPEGKLSLNGEEALGYARMRHEDPRGDFGRQLRQREVIEAVIQKGSNISTITKFNGIADVIEGNLKTNLSIEEMWNIQSKYKNAIHHIKSHEIKGEGKKVDGKYLYDPDDEQLEKLSQTLKDHLELEE